METKEGRDTFTVELNQLRSRQVELPTEGFNALASVLWAALTMCSGHNDIHNAKIIMMLSQTFYRAIKDVTLDNSEDNNQHIENQGDEEISNEKLEYLNRSNNASDSDSDMEFHDANELAISSTPKKLPPVSPSKIASSSQTTPNSIKKRSSIIDRGATRQYIKVMLCTHPIWKDINFWEQTLCQCAFEQLQSMPHDEAWHDMNTETRCIMVKQVHEVVFSQVMGNSLHYVHTLLFLLILFNVFSSNDSLYDGTELLGRSS